MSERDKILTACGWFADIELPLVAERIVNHTADHIAKLEAFKAEVEGLKYLIKIMANQHTSGAMDSEQLESADFESEYNSMVIKSRDLWRDLTISFDKFEQE